MSVDDRELIEACLQGRTEAFGELVRRYQDRVYNTVYRLLGQAEDAQDALQETFLSAFHSLDSFKGESQFFTWLYRIAVNSAISLRRKRRVGMRLENEHHEGTMSAEPADDSEWSQPGLALEKADDERRMQRILNRLSSDHRIVLVLKEIDGLKYEAIAEVLRVPIGTVRSRLFRARMELRGILEESDSPENSLE